MQQKPRNPWPVRVLNCVGRLGVGSGALWYSFYRAAPGVKNTTELLVFMAMFFVAGKLLEWLMRDYVFNYGRSSGSDSYSRSSPDRNPKVWDDDRDIGGTGFPYIVTDLLLPGGAILAALFLWLRIQGKTSSVEDQLISFTMPCILTLSAVSAALALLRKVPNLRENVAAKVPPKTDGATSEAVPFKLLNRLGRFGLGAAAEGLIVTSICFGTLTNCAIVTTCFYLVGFLVEYVLRACWLDDLAEPDYARGGTGFVGWATDSLLPAGASIVGLLLWWALRNSQFHVAPFGHELPFQPGHGTYVGHIVAYPVIGGVIAVLGVSLPLGFGRRAREREAEEQRIAAEQRRIAEEVERKRIADEERQMREEEERERRRREEEQRALVRRRADEERALQVRQAEIERKQREAEELQQIAQIAQSFHGGSAKQSLTITKEIGGAEVVLSAEYDPNARALAERSAELESLQRDIRLLQEREDYNRQMTALERERERLDREWDERELRQELRAIRDEAEREAAEQHHAMRVLKDQMETDRQRQSVERERDQVRRDREALERQRETLQREIKEMEERLAVEKELASLRAENERLKKRETSEEALRDTPDHNW